MDFRELGRELARLGTADDRVKVLDVDHSATTFQLPQIEQRVRVGAFYVRPPTGVSAQELRELFDKGDDLAFRYKVTSGIGTDHVELLTPDEYARQYFSGSQKLIHIEGARKAAREQLEGIFDALKAEFDPEQFPHLDDVVISGHKEGSEESSTEVKLLAYDDDYRVTSQIERDITKRLTEGNLQREIDVRRHLVKETKPEIMLTSTAKSTVKGRQFLNNLATFLLARDGGIQTKAIRAVPKLIERSQPSAYKSLSQAFPRTQTIVRKPAEIVNDAANRFFETLSGMTAFKDLEVKKMPQGLQVQYSKNLIGGRRFDASDLRELRGVHLAILGSPGLREGWSAYHRYDKKDRVLKIRFTTPDEELDESWVKLGQT